MRTVLFGLTLDHPARSSLAATATGAPRNAAQSGSCAKANLDLVEGRSTQPRRPTTRPSHRGGAARRRSLAGHQTRRAARATSPRSRTPSRSSSASRRVQVAWSAVPFNNSFRPGKKPFDFYMAQVSYRPERARAVAFSNSYYFVNQAVVGERRHVRSRASRPLRASGRTSSGPGRYDELQLHHEVHQALRRARPCTTRTTTRSRRSTSGQIDGIVVDLPTAFFVVAVQVDDGTIVGKLPQHGAREQFGIILEGQHTSCVHESCDQSSLGERHDQRFSAEVPAQAGAPSSR